MSGDISVESLVMGLNAEQMRRRFRRCGRSFSQPVDTSDIIGERADGALPYICSLGDNIVLCNVSAQFQLAIVDCAGRIAEGNEIFLYVVREGISPQMRCGARTIRSGDKEDATHPFSGSVTRANDFGVGWH